MMTDSRHAGRCTVLKWRRGLRFRASVRRYAQRVPLMDAPRKRRCAFLGKCELPSWLSHGESFCLPLTTGRLHNEAYAWN